MPELIPLFDYAFIAAVTSSGVYDMESADELTLQVIVNDFQVEGGGAGSLHVDLLHSNNGLNWESLEMRTYTGATTDVISHSSGLLGKFRVDLTPDPLPWDAGGVRATVSISALVREGDS